MFYINFKPLHAVSSLHEPYLSLLSQTHNLMPWQCPSLFVMIKGKIITLTEINF